MDSKAKYQRKFLIFAREDNGFGSGQEPAGHVRVEVWDETGKLWASVQNLMEDNKKLRYVVYAIKQDDKESYAACAGTISLLRGKGELKWEFDANNVAGSGYTIEEFNIFAVLAEYMDRENNRVICPLAAYKDRKTEWRSRIQDYIYGPRKYSKVSEGKQQAEKMEKPVLTVKESEQDAKSPGLNEKAVQTETVPKAQNLEKKENDQEGKITFSGSKEETADSQGIADFMELFSKYTSELESIYSPLKGNISQEMKEETVSKEEKEPGEIAKQEKKGEQVDKESKKEMPGGVAAPIVEKNAGTVGDTEIKNRMAGQNEAGACKYKSEGYCGLQNGAGGINPCAQCAMHKAVQSAPSNTNPTENVEKLKEFFNKYFEEYDPFGSKRNNYKWWKVNSPVYLNNLMYQCNIKAPLLFNPKVLMAHFKYRHLMVGIYTDRVKKREYIVCGVPGVYSIDERPFGEMCRWVQLEGYRPRYGAFGYWLVYIEPKNGKLLRVT